jgi:polyhydroxyalkanoate synthesis regulator phasin
VKVRVKKSFIITPNTYNKNEIKEFPDELVERFVNAGLIEIIENLEEKTVSELKKMLSDRNLSTKGKKKELIERLRENE